MNILKEHAHKYNLIYLENFNYGGKEYPIMITTRPFVQRYDFVCFNDNGQLMALSTLDYEWESLKEDNPKIKLSLDMVHKHTLCDFIKTLPYDALELLDLSIPSTPNWKVLKP